MEDAIEGYSYSALPNPSSFRLLELSPGQDEDEVSFQLVIVDWDKPPQYEAISYAWGLPSWKATTICDGKHLTISTNLLSALSHLRYPNRTRVLWADAICIDQQNTSERSHQVNNMKKIYQQASGVLVWLGPDPEGCAGAAIDAVHKVSSHLCRSAGIKVTDLKDIKYLRRDVAKKTHSMPQQLKVCTTRTWTALQYLLSHSWFRRIWVIQEVNSNKKSRVVWGSRSVEWLRIVLIAEYIYLYDSFYHGELKFDESFCEKALTMGGVNFRFGAPYLQMLAKASQFAATDPRDKVFALLGLPTFAEQCPSLKADYSKPLLEVYCDVVELSIAMSDSLDVLCFAGHISDPIWAYEISLPSWIPRWDSSVTRRKYPNRKHWNTSGNSQPSFSIENERTLLRVLGISVDTIAKTEEFEFFQVRGRTARDNAPFWTKIVEMATSSPLEQDRVLATAMAFSYGLDASGVRVREQRRREDFLRFLKSYVGLSTEGEFQEHRSLRVHDPYGRAFHNDAYNNCHTERFFLTRKGYIGCGPPETKEGDVVCILFGSQMPFILRQEEDHMLLIGNAYVHGMMKGEVFNSWNQGELPEIEDQYFNIH